MAADISGEYDEIELVLGMDVIQKMESRGILQNEVKMVIHEAEATGVKLYEPEADRSLAKKRIADTTYFIVYKPVSDSAFEVETAYCCKTEIVEE
jgi:hypothetical protein